MKTLNPLSKAGRALNDSGGIFFSHKGAKDSPGPNILYLTNNKTNKNTFLMPFSYLSK